MTLLETTRPSLGRDTENVRPFIVASPEPGSAPLTLRAISKRWRHGMPPVLDDVSLSLKPGTTTCIGGRNGVGKTTLLRICAGLIEPECGRAEVWGFTARENRAQYQRLVSLLSAGDRGLYARLSVRHHLDFCARIAMVPREQARRIGRGCAQLLRPACTRRPASRPAVDGSAPTTPDRDDVPSATRGCVAGRASHQPRPRGRSPPARGERGGPSARRHSSVVLS